MRCAKVSSAVPHNTVAHTENGLCMYESMNALIISGKLFMVQFGVCTLDSLGEYVHMFLGRDGSKINRGVYAMAIE